MLKVQSMYRAGPVALISN